MEKISSNGEVFVKASSIARELGYTSDYVGQLCRTGQVDAQLVGRSWFVNEDSIREHKRNRYRSTKAKSQKWVRESLTHTPSVSASVSSSTTFGVSLPKQQPSAQYETDESDVLPVIGKKSIVEEFDTPEPTPEPEDEERIVPLRFEAENVSEEEEEEVEIEAENEQEEQDAAAVQDDDTYIIPLRKPTPPAMHRTDIVTIRPMARTERTPLVKNEAVIQNKEDEEDEVEEEETRTGGSAERMVLVASFVTALALVGAVTLVGLESRHIVDQSGSLDSYEFNLASAMTAFQEARNAE